MSDTMIAHRTFETYDDYVYHQGVKSRGRREFLLKHLPKNIGVFRNLFVKASFALTPGPILCLGARTGAESLGAVEAGFAGSVGMDLHPVGPTVVQGDWHDLQFSAGSFANAYTNSLDHCLDLDKFAGEVRRVLRPDGRFYLMATNRPGVSAESWLKNPNHDALYWETSDHLADAIVARGFTWAHSWRDGKWGHYVFTVRRG